MRFTYLSPSVERLLGYTPEECCRIAPQGTLTAAALATVQQALQEELANEAAQPGSAQGRLLRLDQRHRDGHIVPTEVMTAFARDADGRITGLTGVTRDISERVATETALRASEERYRSLFTTMTDGVALHELVTGADGTPCDYRLLDVNPAYEQILGIAREQVVGKLATEAYGVTPAPYLEEYARVARSGIPHGFTTYFAPLQRHFRITAYAPEAGKFATVFEDVTERLRTEEALRESQEMLSAFMRHSPIYTFIKEVNAECSRVLQASENYSEMIGVPGSAMAGKTMEDLFPAEFARKITADDRAVVQGGTVLKLDEELNGRHYTTIKFPIVQGGRTLLAGYTIDITERVRVEQELRASTERYQTLFSVETDAILLTDVASGRIVEANPAACQCHGYDHAEMLRLRLPDLSAEPEETQRMLDSDSDEPVRIPLRWHRKRDGSQFPVEIAARFFTLAGRRLLLETLRDIGDRLRQEAERERLLAALTAANNDLRSLDELKSNLLSNVSHELRTPLVAVRGYAEMMREGMSGPVTARQGEQFGIMLRNIDRLLMLIDNLLDYSRQQKGQESLQCAAFPVVGLVHDAVTLLLPRAQEKQITLHVADAGDGLQLTGDRRKLQQVLINLIDNALKFTPQGGTVTVTAAAPGAETLCLTVQDNGIGIPEQQYERIFERFYQVDGSSTRGHSGIGIGLAIVRDIVTLHGGTVTVTSTPGEGTIFTITLPLGGPVAA